MISCESVKDTNLLKNQSLPSSKLAYSNNNSQTKGNPWVAQCTLPSLQLSNFTKWRKIHEQIQQQNKRTK